MKYKIQSIHFDADDGLISLINKKLDKLEKFRDYIIDGEVFLLQEHNGNDDNKVVEIKLNMKGKTLFGKEQRESFEEAVDAAIDTMQRQVKKYKGKLQG